MTETVSQAVATVSAPRTLIEVQAPTEWDAIRAEWAAELAPVVRRQMRRSILATASDIPRSCFKCRWCWRIKQQRWTIIQVFPGCPWHGKG